MRLLHLSGCLPLLAALAWTPTAVAGNSAYMYGFGPRLGSIVWPGAYPSNFPSFDAVDENGDETGEKVKIADDTSIEKVNGDLIIGVEGDYWADGSNRLGALAGLGLGSGYNDAHLIIKYDKMYSMDALDTFVGGGLGVGVTNWVGENNDRLRVPYYPFRGELGALVRQGGWAVQGLAFLHLNIPGRQVLTLADGLEHESGFGWAVYLQVGVEIQLLFGDFTKPRGRNRNK